MIKKKCPICCNRICRICEIEFIPNYESDDLCLDCQENACD